MKQGKLTLFISIFIVVFSFSSSSIWADEKGAIELTMTVFEEVEVINKQGETVSKLIDPESIVPGDKVVYTTEYHNKGEKKADQVAITNPVPKNLIYIDGSAEHSGAPVVFSFDDGKHFDLANKLMIKNDDGTHRVATSKDYTHIRWIIESMAPQDKGIVQFSAKLK